MKLLVAFLVNIFSVPFSAAADGFNVNFEPILCAKLCFGTAGVSYGKAKWEPKSRARKSQKARRSRRYDYWVETQRPMVCLVFTMPLLLWYELGMVLHPTAIRSGVDRLLQTMLSPVGDTSLVLLPVVTIGVLLFLHHRRQDDIRFHPRTVLAMVAESLGLAMILFIGCDALMLCLSDQQPRPLTGLATLFTDRQQYARVLTCVGAGVYEELLFRLLMFGPLLHWMREKTGRENVSLMVTAVLVSFMFAGAHCDQFNPEGMPFDASAFLFRFLASVFLCFLFRFRGIGIAIGVHAVFDILAIS